MSEHSMYNHVHIQSRDHWFKIVGMLQHNWALVDESRDGSGVTVYFLHDRSGVFDRMHFHDSHSAEVGLRRNGFARFCDDSEVQEFLTPPGPPFWEAEHPNGPIYSSGRFWR